MICQHEADQITCGVRCSGGSDDGSDIRVRGSGCGCSDNTNSNAFGGNNTLKCSRIDHARDDVRNNNIMINNMGKETAPLT